MTEEETFELFLPRMPNNRNGDQDCANVKWDGVELRQGFDDTDCANNRQYLCEIPLD